VNTSLIDLLFKGYRRRVLDLLLRHPEQQYHVREIARLTDTVAGTLHKELSKLAEAGLLRKASIGNQVFYEVNPDCLMLDALTEIFQITHQSKNNTGMPKMDALVE